MVTGLGLGMTFPSFTIAVQNASPAGQLGAVTSATQFYRSIGGALGLAVLGSYMANRFAAGLQDSLPPAIRQALPADQLARMEENPQALVNPQAMDALRAAFADRGPQGEAIVTQLIDEPSGDTGIGYQFRLRGGCGSAGHRIRGHDLPARGATPGTRFGAGSVIASACGVRKRH